MGIDNFHTWLRTNFYDSIMKCNSQPYDHVYIDLNYILHKHVSYVKTADELINNVINTIEHIINTNKPIKTLNLVADGSANYAKIILQKKRRLQMAQSILSRNYNIDHINPLHLTPGTQFMKKFNNAIKTFAYNNTNEFSINVNVSDKPDESEFKICRLIRSNTQNITDTHLLFSNDADMILIAMALNGIYGIDTMIQLQGGNNYIVSLNMLIEQNMEFYGYTMLKRLDFVFISLLNGNDYFPKLKYSNFNNLWNAYKQYIAPNETIMTETMDFNLEILQKYMFGISKMYKGHFSTNNASSKIISTKTINSYLYGLKWCMMLYSSGKYATYDYSYNGESIHPFDIVLHISLQTKTINDELKIIESSCIPIQSDIYALLVLPYAAKELVPHQYHKYMKDKLWFMYKEENCEDCKNYRKHYNCTEPNCEYPNSEYKIHKQNHDIKNLKKYITKILNIIEQ